MPAAWVSAAAAAYGALSKDDAPSGGGGGGGANNEVRKSVTSGGSTSKSYLDPRMENLIYGAGGVIPNAVDWYGKNSSGLNDKMITGMNNQWNQLGASKQGFDQMQNLGMGLMGGGVASNPFTGGGGMPSGTMPQQQNMQYVPANYTQSAANQFQMPAPMQAPSLTPMAAAGGGGGYGEPAPVAPVEVKKPAMTDEDLWNFYTGGSSGMGA